jgi:hypothetical protein
LEANNGEVTMTTEITETEDFTPTLQRLETLARDHLLSFRVAIGQTLLNDLFAGDAEAYSSRDRTKSVRFAAFLAAHGAHLSEVGLSEHMLRRCIVSAIVARDLPDGLIPQLVVAQVLELHRVEDRGHRRVLAQAAVDNGWTREDLRNAAIAVKAGQWIDADPNTPGLQPPVPPEEPVRALATGRVVTRIEKAAGSIADLKGQLGAEEAAGLSKAQRERLRAVATQLRAEAEALEAALG